MGGAVVEDGATYSGTMAFVYVFNLVVGFGALTLPSVFYQAGYVLGGLFMAVLGVISFVTATFVVEAMSLGNAVEFLGLHNSGNKYEMVSTSTTLEGDSSDTVDISNHAQNKGTSPKNTGKQVAPDATKLRRPRLQSRKDDHHPIDIGHIVAGSSSDGGIDDDEFDSRMKNEPFELRNKLELGDMAKLFMGNFGYKVLMAITGIYLYGDLAIYASATPTTLISLFPGDRKEITIPLLDWTYPVDQDSSYSAWLMLFSCIVVPLSCLNFQKTKHLQIFTCTYRNAALVSMIALAAIRYEKHVLSGRGGDDEPDLELKQFNPAGLPKLFGAATYSFMCHHSLPSIIFPIDAESRPYIMKILGLDYVAILITYLILCITAFLAFASYKDIICEEEPSTLSCAIQGIYILNFSSGTNPFFGDFLTLLPVFICFTNFPLIAITTRNNLIVWFNWFYNRITGGIIPPGEVRLWHSLIVAVPPIIIAFVIHDVSIIVEFTGSYAGLALEFLFPCWLVVSARKAVNRLDPEIRQGNPYRSPFQSNVAVAIVLLWSVTSLCFIFFQQAGAFATDDDY